MTPNYSERIVKLQRQSATFAAEDFMNLAAAYHPLAAKARAKARAPLDAMAHWIGVYQKAKAKAKERRKVFIDCIGTASSSNSVFAGVATTCALTPVLSGALKSRAGSTFDTPSAVCSPHHQL